jgi:uncharacterized membrane protein
MTTTIDPDIANYLDEVRSHLSDLDPEELEELLDDILLHMQEVQAETDGSLRTVLGDPSAFAAESRALGIPSKCGDIHYEEMS